MGTRWKFTILVLHYVLTVQLCQAFTHWVVTEDGRIQAQIDSVFSLRRPYDLMALMQQEERAVLLKELKQQLLTQKDEIDSKEDKETSLEEKIYANTEDCILAEKPLREYDLYIGSGIPFSYKGIDIDLFLRKEAGTKDYRKPNCSEICKLDFSMHTFEHLMGVRERHNLTMLPEEYLQKEINEIVPTMDIEEYGHIIQQALSQNTSSWVLYNLAAYYWRIKGDALNAIECIRRALHFSPREYKDMALMNLGSVLHRSHYSEEAAIVIHAAVDTSPEYPLYHYTLGTIYAVLADYNKSVICFENALKLDPDFKNSQQMLHAVLCHSQLEKALEAQHDSLQRTLAELREYQKQYELWLQQHEKLLSEQVPPEVKLEQSLEYEEQKIRESLDGQDCFQYEQNGHTVFSCNVRREMYTLGAGAKVDLSLSLQLIQAVESRAGKLGKKIAEKVPPDQCQRS